MPADPSMPKTVNRTVRLRLLPETVTKARQLAGTAGACRWVWNHFLARQQCRWQCWQDYKIGSPPQVSFFRLARSSEYSWLQEYSYAAVCHALKHLADAYQRFFHRQGGHPQFKARHRTVDGFTMADAVSLLSS